ncbi:TPA: XRE family transcriptional regulator, partial [Staphylococcus aureus]
MTTSVADKPYLKIKSLIALKGTNQKEVAKAIGMSRS